MATKVIDVSEHQGVIDWEKVKKSGIKGAIIRCGYGSDDASQDDKQWKRNVSECERLGIPYGVYLYSYAANTEMAKSEAAHVLRLIKGHKLSYPVYYDLEEEAYASAAKANAIAFGDIIEKAGYWCGVYTWPRWFNTHLKGLERFTKWPCEWGVSKCSIPCDMWQYADNGRVNGISGAVDMNYCYRDFPKEIAGTTTKTTTNNKTTEKTANKTTNTTKKTTSKKSIETIAKEVINGKWGNGWNRKTALEAAGYDYDKVQAQVNKIIASKVLKVGAKVKIKQGAHQYGSTAIFGAQVYKTVYKVVEIMGNRVVFATTTNNVVIGAVAKKDCIVQ